MGNTNMFKEKYSQSIDFLLRNAGPSIRYRVKKQILGEISPEEETELQAQIMAEPISILIANCQKENGWLGNGFHGPNKNAGPYENQEVGTKYLAEKGVCKDNPVLQRAMEAFVTTELTDLCYRTKGKYFDEFRYAANGQNIIRCACIARAGYDDIIDIQPQIQLSLDSFRRVLEVDSILDITRPRKGKPCRSNPSGINYVFNDNERWPCRYHLDILAHTESWKNEENTKMLADSITKMMKSDRPELIGRGANSWVGYQLGTLGCFPSQGLTIKQTCLLPSPVSIEYRGRAELYNLEYIEWFARCGVVPYIPVLQEAVEEISHSIDENGFCNIPVLEDALRGIGTYGGQQLEENWKTHTRKICDITFRALLILYYADIK